MAQIVYQIIKKPLEERLIDAACIYWEVDRRFFMQKSEKNEVVYRKGIVYYCIKKLCPHLSYRAIGNKFGFEAHMPVRRLVENLDSQKDIYKQTFNDINQIVHIADKLDAEFITQSISLGNKQATT